MTRRLNSLMRFVLLFLLACQFAAAKQANLMQQLEWKGSKLVGTPEPPLPFITEMVWPDLPVKKPLEMKRLPGSKEFLVYSDHREEKGSISKLWVFRDTPKVAKQFESLSLTNR